LKTQALPTRGDPLDLATDPSTIERALHRTGNKDWDLATSIGHLAESKLEIHFIPNPLRRNERGPH